MLQLTLNCTPEKIEDNRVRQYAILISSMATPFTPGAFHLMRFMRAMSISFLIAFGLDDLRVFCLEPGPCLHSDVFRGDRAGFEDSFCKEGKGGEARGCRQVLGEGVYITDSSGVVRGYYINITFCSFLLVFCR